MLNLKEWADRFDLSLQEVQGTGTFAVQGDADLPDPGLEVEGVGAIPVPISARDGRKLIAVAKRAPFGRGTEKGCRYGGSPLLGAGP